MKPCMLIILDGWGYKPRSAFNATEACHPINFERLWREYPHTTLKASGMAVGLPDGIMGNSEVGHLNIGAGRIVYQDLLRIDRAIANGSFEQNAVLRNAMNKVTANGRLHLIGLLSDGGVHSQLTHCCALLDMAQSLGVKDARVHAILDGRDTPPCSGINYIQKLEGHMAAQNYGRIATICGRYYAMDRDNRWDRVSRAYDLYTVGKGIEERTPEAAIRNAYARGETDEFVQPIFIADNAGAPLGRMMDDDVVIFFNFRADRAREITRAFTERDFTGFIRAQRPLFKEYVCMTMYDEHFNLPMAFGPERPANVLGEVVSKAGLKQLRIAETEKYAHVTYFFNGGEETSFDNEDRCLIPSPRDVATYDFRPQMSAYAVTDEVLQRLAGNYYDFVVLNYANPDMVGHTGIMEAATVACYVADECLGKVIALLQEKGWGAIVTADHGNAEVMQDEDGQPQTAHTTNPVPCIIVDDRFKGAALRQNGSLCDLAPTLLAMMGLGQPQEMTGLSLLPDIAKI